MAWFLGLLKGVYENADVSLFVAMQRLRQSRVYFVTVHEKSGKYEKKNAASGILEQ